MNGTSFYCNRIFHVENFKFLLFVWIDLNFKKFHTTQHERYDSRERERGNLLTTNNISNEIPLNSCMEYLCQKVDDHPPFWDSFRGIIRGKQKWVTVWRRASHDENWHEWNFSLSLISAKEKNKIKHREIKICINFHHHVEYRS